MGHSSSLLFQILECAHRLGDEPIAAVAHLALTECHGAGAVIGGALKEEDVISKCGQLSHGKAEDCSLCRAIRTRGKREPHMGRWAYLGASS